MLQFLVIKVEKFRLRKIHEKMSLKEYSDAASKGDQEKAVHKQRRRSKNFLKLFIALTTLLSVVRGENQSLMQCLGINLLVGASIASNYIFSYLHAFIIFEYIWNIPLGELS